MNGVADLGLTFQVTDVRKPLLSVKRLTEKGNTVCFGLDSFEGKWQRVIFDDGQISGGNDTSITIDSGAEESVCPKVWGSQFGINSGVPKIDFRNGSGWGN